MPPAATARFRAHPGRVLALLGAGLVVAAIVALGSGAVAIPPVRVLAVLTGAETAPGDALIVLQVRLPRVLLGLLIGAGLAVSGVLMQGLFRNPLADPGLIGISSGAALAAGATIVLGDTLLAPFVGRLPFLALPLGAFLGGLATTLLLYLIATREGRTSIATLLLAGVALAALAGAMLGFLTYLSNDQQLRDLSFWSMGSLSGANWTKAGVVAAFVMPALAAMPFLARSLNALTLGEAEAFHLGVPVQRAKAGIILIVAITVGAAVAAAGVIGFVGIVVPHALRLAFGADHRLLLPASALAGGGLIVLADTIARTVVAPAELPIGILTAALGAPFFLWLLLGRGRGLLP